MQVRELNPRLIEKVRVRAGFTQDELAWQIRKRSNERFKPSGAAVSRWERGVHKPASNALPFIADACGVELDELYGDDDDEEDEARMKHVLAELVDRGQFDLAEDLMTVLKRRETLA